VISRSWSSRGRVLAVDRVQRVAQLGEEPLEAQAERVVAAGPRGPSLELGTHLRAHDVDVLHVLVSAAAPSCGAP
jgi:hypothetical protein